MDFQFKSKPRVDWSYLFYITLLVFSYFKCEISNTKTQIQCLYRPFNKKKKKRKLIIWSIWCLIDHIKSILVNSYQFWVRSNSVQVELAYVLNSSTILSLVSFKLKIVLNKVNEWMKKKNKGNDSYHLYITLNSLLYFL